MQWGGVSCWDLDVAPRLVDNVIWPVAHDYTAIIHSSSSHQVWENNDKKRDFRLGESDCTQIIMRVHIILIGYGYGYTNWRVINKKRRGYSGEQKKWQIVSSFSHHCKSWEKVTETRFWERRFCFQSCSWREISAAGNCPRWDSVGHHGEAGKMMAMLIHSEQKHYKHFWHCEWAQLVQVLLMTKIPPQRWQWTAWALIGIGLEMVLVMGSIVAIRWFVVAEYWFVIGVKRLNLVKCFYECIIGRTSSENQRMMNLRRAEGRQ